jgi:hypothetical protein
MTKRRDLSVRNVSNEALPLPPPPMVRGEDAGAYERLAARITAAVAPDDVIEQLLVRDVVDLVWDVMRLRRLKAHLFTVGAGDGMAKLLRAIGAHDINAGDWAARKPGAVAAVNTQLSAAGLDMDDVTTSTFAVRIDQFERIERMLAAAEVRRAAALNAIDGRRAFAERLRAAALAAERDAAPVDGEFALVPDNASDGAPEAAARSEPA